MTVQSTLQMVPVQTIDKLCSAEALVECVARLPRPLVLTNGVFDVLHRGHVTYLEQARSLGAALVVAVNSDRSARMLGKGPDRPLNCLQDRSLVLAALQAVTLVASFDDRTPVNLIKLIRPDIYVKGGDYDIERLEETHCVRSWGGTAVAMPYLNGYSTTALVQRVRSAS